MRLLTAVFLFIAAASFGLPTPAERAELKVRNFLYAKSTLFSDDIEELYEINFNVSPFQGYRAAVIEKLAILLANSRALSHRQCDTKVAAIALLHHWGETGPHEHELLLSLIELPFSNGAGLKQGLSARDRAKAIRAMLALKLRPTQIAYPLLLQIERSGSDEARLLAAETLIGLLAEFPEVRTALEAQEVWSRFPAALLDLSGHLDSKLIEATTNPRADRGADTKLENLQAAVESANKLLRKAGQLTGIPDLGLQRGDLETIFTESLASGSNLEMAVLRACAKSLREIRRRR